MEYLARRHAHRILVKDFFYRGQSLTIMRNFFRCRVTAGTSAPRIPAAVVCNFLPKTRHKSPARE